ncbi:Gfo/Idh/MocA family oxidoreductase [Desulfococcaceae bacterium HSG7]|nr:Gfo/Idh/MocA family oxidoreductase [Desulfococcaceae bacterium HSG7]
MQKLNVGVIGVGYLGKFHAEKYAGMENVDLVGVVDVDPYKAKDISAKLNTHPYFNYKDIINKVDAVSIAAPTPDHFRISRDFLTHGVDVLIEKPMTVTIQEADELIKTAEARGLIIQVGHLERFNPAVIALRDIVKKPGFIESHRLSVYKNRCADVSVVLDLMIHDIDIITNFVHSDIKQIHAAGVSVISGHTDIANARLEFENGCVANVTASRISRHNERKIRLFQKDAYISVDFANQEVDVIRKNGNPGTGILPGAKIEQIRFPQQDVLQEELTAFVKSVKYREAPQVSGVVGRNALNIALNIMKQIK